MARQRRQRDFQAEYRRRQEQGKDRGLSPSQIRGHAKTGEAKVSELRTQGKITAPRYTTQSLVTADGTYHSAVELDKRNSRKLARWNNARAKIMDKRTSRYTKREAERELRSFKGKTVTDVRGNKYQLASDMNTIQQAETEGSPEGVFTFLKHYKEPGRGEVAA